MMETDNWPRQLRSSPASSYKNQSVLILNQNPTSCAAGQCGDLPGLLQRSIPVGCVREGKENLRPDDLSFIPDLILLRVSIARVAQKLIASCKRIWSCAAILALFCVGSNEPIDILPCDFDAVDDFVSCPFREGELTFRIKRLLQSKSATKMSSDFAEGKRNFHPISLVGESPSFLRVVDKIPLLAACCETVLISGETGSGKEVFSRAIHYQSARRGKPFVPVNCGALPDHLCETELFGHVKGAFTDASSAEKGLIAEAEGGTLFLDEVGTLSQAGQIKLLRFLQDGEYRPVGSGRSVNADVRILAASNDDLLKQVEKKQFREDLYYRLNALSLRIPALRDRIEDVVPLAAHFLDRYAREHCQGGRVLSTGALDKLMAYSWPGNIRELESIITRALTFSRAPMLEAEDIELPMAAGDAISRSRSLREAKSNTIAAFERRYL